jgi:hypothetical protein
MEDFDDFLEIIDFGFHGFSSQGLRSGRFHEQDKFRFYSRFNLTKASVLHFLILIEEEIEFPADTQVVVRYFAIV